MATAWKTIPLDAKLAILPIFLFVFLIESGQDLALALCGVVMCAERCEYPGGTAKPTVADIYAVIISVHVLFTLVITYYVNTLKRRRIALYNDDPAIRVDRSATGAMDIAEELATYAAAFLSMAKLVTISIQTSRIEFFAIFLLYFVYMYLIPIVSLVIPRGSIGGQSPSIGEWIARMQISLLIVVAAVAGAGAAYFVIVNSLTLLIGIDVVRSALGFDELGNKIQSWWVINPAVLAIGFGQIFSFYWSRLVMEKSFAPIMRIAWRTHGFFLTLALVLNMTLGILILDGVSWVRSAQIGADFLSATLAAFYFLCFLLSAIASMAALATRRFSRYPVMAVTTILLVGGGIAGSGLMVAHMFVSPEGTVPFGLIFYHSLGFLVGGLSFFFACVGVSRLFDLGLPSGLSMALHRNRDEETGTV